MTLSENCNKILEGAVDLVSARRYYLRGAGVVPAGWFDWRCSMSLTAQMETELRRLAEQLKAAGLRVYWFKGGEQIKVYSVTLDAFADVWLRKPNHCWMYAMDIVPTERRYHGFVTMESAQLHIAHVLGALSLAGADSQKRTNAMWRMEDKSMWELV